MVRITYKVHEINIPQANDPTKTVSKTVYEAEDHHAETGMIGFPGTDRTIATGKVIILDSLTTLRGEGAAADALDFIEYGAGPEIADKDLVWLQQGAEAITLNHNTSTPPSNSGPLLLLSKANKKMIGVRMALFQRQGNNFQEIAFDGTVGDGGVIVEDDSGNAILLAGSVASAVNHLKVTNAATGNQVLVEVAGTDSDIGMKFNPKGTGFFTFAGNVIHQGRNQMDKGIDVASPGGGIMTLGGDGNVFDITGTNTINEILATTWQAGSQIILQFDAVLTITNNSGGTNDILTGNGANITTAAGFVLGLVFDGTDWIEAFRNTVGGIGDALVANPLSQFAATTSAQLLATISDETGTGVLVFNNGCTLIAPALGIPVSGVCTNLTGLPLTTGVTGVLPSANMDADTAHLTTTQTFSGLKTFTLLATFSAGVDLAGKDADNVQNIIRDISVTTVALDFAADELQTITVSATATFTCAAYVAGKSKTIKILDSGSGQTLAFPAGWKFVGTKPTAIVASKTGILTLTCFSTTEASVVAAYAEEA